MIHYVALTLLILFFADMTHISPMIFAEAFAFCQLRHFAISAADMPTLRC